MVSTKRGRFFTSNLGLTVGLVAIALGATLLGQEHSLLSYVAPEYRAGLLEWDADRDRSLPPLNEDTLALHKSRRGKKTFEFLDVTSVEKETIPGLPGEEEVSFYLINAESESENDNRPGLVYIHGGGYIFGTADGSVPMLQEVAVKHDCVVVSVEYRLAPETPFPGSLHDNYACLKWLHDHADTLGVDVDRIAIMGESAGGGHAASLAIEARNRGEVPVCYQVLIYPMLDDRTGSVYQQPHWMGHLSWTPAMNRLGWSSLLGVPAGSEQVPVGSVPARVKDLTRLPPTHIVIGSIDLFVNENIEYARRLIQAGVPVELHVLPGGFHRFQYANPEAPDSIRFYEGIDRALERAFAASDRSDNF